MGHVLRRHGPWLFAALMVVMVLQLPGQKIALPDGVHVAVLSVLVMLLTPIMVWLTNRHIAMHANSDRLKDAVCSGRAADFLYLRRQGWFLTLAFGLVSLAWYAFAGSPQMPGYAPSTLLVWYALWLGSGAGVCLSCMFGMSGAASIVGEF